TMHLGRLILLAMATLSLTSCKPQPTTPLTALDIIREADSIHESRVGFGAQRTEVYEAYLIFRDTHSREQLLEFTDDPNLNIRGYAAKALREKFPNNHRDCKKLRRPVLLRHRDQPAASLLRLPQKELFGWLIIHLQRAILSNSGRL
ncbi:hypothetical protein N9230_01190, partial [Akkermansiaceae bacterium]|nr:hypothetical protein [Akkermansiaceae bacterium]